MKVEVVKGADVVLAVVGLGVEGCLHATAHVSHTACEV